MLRPAAGRADNPIVQTNYTADPAPMVYDGVVYVFTGHDEDATVNGFFTMNDWRAYSSTDMVNWTDYGSPMSYHTGRARAGRAAVAPSPRQAVASAHQNCVMNFQTSGGFQLVDCPGSRGDGS
jgi:hypothetical protein